MKFRLTSLEKKDGFCMMWPILPLLLLVATILPIYFNDLAGRSGLSSVDYLAYWGYATSLQPFWWRFWVPLWGRCPI